MATGAQVDPTVAATRYASVVRVALPVHGSDGGVVMAGFIQIMEFETSHIDELEALMKTFQKERGDALLATKATITEDRTRPGHFLVIVEFDSYEEAMRNSNDPVTSEYAEKVAAMLEGPQIFHDLDVRSVIHVRE